MFFYSAGKREHRGVVILYILVFMYNAYYIIYTYIHKVHARERMMVYLCTDYRRQSSTNLRAGCSKNNIYIYSYNIIYSEDFFLLHYRDGFFRLIRRYTPQTIDDNCSGEYIMNISKTSR